MKNIRHQWLRYSLCFALLVVLFSPIVEEFTETKLTTDFAFGELPVGQKTLAGQEGDYCMYYEKVSWIKHFVGPDGCIKVGYIVEEECGRYTDQWRNVNGMSKCERPVIPESQPKQYEQPKYTEPPKPYEQPKQYEQPQSSNSKINQDDDYVIWAVLGIVGIVAIVGIIKLITKPNNAVPAPRPVINPPGGDNDGGKSEIEIETEEIDEETRRINEELYGENSSSAGNTPTDIEEGYDYEEDEDQGAAEIEDDYENDDQSNDDQSNDENESIREDIEERISNNEEALEGLREYRQEIEDDREGGLFENMHDMHEADRTDDKISEREERIEELNEALDDYESQSDDNDHDDDYDDDDR